MVICSLLALLTLFSLSLRYPRATQSKIKETIREYGYNMRTLAQVLRGGSARLMGDIAKRVADLSIVNVGSLTKREVEDAGNMSHSLIVSRCLESPQPDSPDYLEGDLLTSTIASPAVWRQLLSANGRKVYMEMSNMLDLFRGIPETATSAGWLWERLCHSNFLRGGAFTLKEMVLTDEEEHLVPSNNTVPITLSQRQPHLFISSDVISRTLEPSHYFMPSSVNNPTFDAFFHLEVAGVGLQMTLAPQQSLISEGLQTLYKHLDKGTRPNWFVFVIRKGSPFKCKTPSKAQMEKFKFFTLELSPPSGEYHFSSLAGVSADDLAFAGVQFDEAKEMDRDRSLDDDMPGCQNQDKRMLVDTN